MTSSGIRPFPAENATKTKLQKNWLCFSLFQNKLTSLYCYFSSSEQASPSDPIEQHLYSPIDEHLSELTRRYSELELKKLFVWFDILYFIVKMFMMTQL